LRRNIAGITATGALWRAPEALTYLALEQIPALPRAVPSHDRLVHQYALHAVLARKPELVAPGRTY
jgi:hypothetical protein